MNVCRQLAVKFTSISEAIDAAQIGVVQREEMRVLLTAAKSRIDDLDKSHKVAIMSNVIEEAKKICQTTTNDIIVHVFNAGSNAKALNTALKEIEKIQPSAAVMAISLDTDVNKLLCLVQVPKVSTIPELS